MALMRYTYRCPLCGMSIERRSHIVNPPPPQIEEEHRAPGTLGQDEVADYCPGTRMHRVWESPMLNLGYRPVKHTPNEEHMFRNL